RTRSADELAHFLQPEIDHRQNPQRSAQQTLANWQIRLRDYLSGFLHSVTRRNRRRQCPQVEAHVLGQAARPRSDFGNAPYSGLVWDSSATTPQAEAGCVCRRSPPPNRRSIDSFDESEPWVDSRRDCSNNRGLLFSGWWPEAGQRKR